MAKLILKGDESYISKMYEHLKKEHPSVKGRISIKHNKTKLKELLLFDDLNINNLKVS